jgi:hypothetical protein
MFLFQKASLPDGHSCLLLNATFDIEEAFAWAGNQLTFCLVIFILMILTIRKFNGVPFRRLWNLDF